MADLVAMGGGLKAADVMAMSDGQKFEEAMQRSLPMLLPEARRQVEAMLTPTSVAFIAAGLAVWAASHLFGAGEIMDVILLGLGLVTLGMGAITGGEELARFVVTAQRAKTDGDLTIAAEHFAKAIDILGITAVSAVLLRQSAKTVIARGVPRFRPTPRVGPPPPPGAKPTILYTVKQMFDNRGRLVNGSCSAYGDIKIWLGNTLAKQKHVEIHELGHRIFTPKLAILREFRATTAMSGYLRSAWLQFLEETMVEARASFIGKGAGEALLSLSFPIKNGYVTISQLAEEMIAVENIVIGGLKYGVYVNEILYSINPPQVSTQPNLKGPN